MEATFLCQWSRRRIAIIPLKAETVSLWVLDGSLKSSTILLTALEKKTVLITKSLLAMLPSTLNFRTPPPRVRISMISRDSMSVNSKSQGSYHLPEMAVASGLINQDSVKVAAVELVNLSTPNDERHPQFLDMSLNANETFPWRKTRSGAINPTMSPLERRTWTNVYFGSSLVFLFMSLATRKPGF